MLYLIINLLRANNCRLFWYPDKMIKLSLLDTLSKHQTNISSPNLQLLSHYSLINRLNISLYGFRLLFKMAGKFCICYVLSDLFAMGVGGVTSLLKLIALLMLCV